MFTTSVDKEVKNLSKVVNRLHKVADKIMARVEAKDKVVAAMNESISADLVEVERARRVAGKFGALID